MSDRAGPTQSPRTPSKKSSQTVYTEALEDKQCRKYNSERAKLEVSTAADLSHRLRVEFSNDKGKATRDHYEKSNKAARQSSNPEQREKEIPIREKQTSVEEVLEHSQKLMALLEFPDHVWQQQGFNQKHRQILLKFNQNLKMQIRALLRELKSRSKSLFTHLNTIFFTSPNIRFKPSRDIERHILKDWRCSTFLRQLLALWHRSVSAWLPLFSQCGAPIFEKVVYQQFRQVLSHLLFFIYQDYYGGRSENREAIVARLQDYTARFVITQSEGWESRSYPVLQKALLHKINATAQIDMGKIQELTVSILGEIRNPTYNELLKSRQERGELLFPEARQAMAHFTKQHSVLGKIKGVINVRVALEQDILTHQKELINQGLISEFQMLEKDELITCLILAVLECPHHLASLELSVHEMKLVLGGKSQEILSEHKCPSYFADIEAAVDFIKQELSPLPCH